MTPTHRGSRIEIRQDIIKKNLRALKVLGGTGFFCPMVKANAYGHGFSRVLPVMKEEKMTSLGVATWDEAQNLRDLGYHNDVLVFSRTHQKDEAQLALKLDLIPVISCVEDLNLFAQMADKEKKSCAVHVKVDTGIHRMGLPFSQIDEVLKVLKSSSHLRMTGLLTHLSHAEDTARAEGHSAQQIRSFLELSEKFKTFHPQLHCLNSLAMLERSKTADDVAALGCRPGIALYGAVPDQRLSSLPAMRVVSQLDNIQQIAKGQGVSYGWTWIAKKDSVIGVVPFGYGDGYPRGLSNKAFMLVHGRRVPVVGNVCMDYTLVDLTALVSEKNVKVADEVVIMGEQKDQLISPGELAQWNDTISYEILTNLGLKKNRVGAV